jgi:hypothetical protein
MALEFSVAMKSRKGEARRRNPTVWLVEAEPSCIDSFN